VGYPGVQSGAFSDLENLYSLTLTGEVGNITTGAFYNVTGRDTFIRVVIIPSLCWYFVVTGFVDNFISWYHDKIEGSSRFYQALFPDDELPYIF